MVVQQQQVEVAARSELAAGVGAQGDNRDLVGEFLGQTLEQCVDAIRALVGGGDAGERDESAG